MQIYPGASSVLNTPIDLRTSSVLHFCGVSCTHFFRDGKRLELKPQKNFIQNLPRLLDPSFFAYSLQNCFIF